MTEQEPRDDAPDTESPKPKPTSSTHLRPLPSPQPDEQLFTPPGRPPKTRPQPPKPEARPQSKPASQSGLPADRVSFPVAKPPPGVPPKPSPDIAPQTPEPDEKKADTAGPTPRPAPAEIETARRSPLYGYILYLALALGTVPLPGEVRYVLLWLLLVGLGSAFLLFDEERPFQGTVDPVHLTWGLGIGFVLSLPLMLTASRALAQTSRALVPIESHPALFQTLVLTWPLGETLLYRGAIQREHGLIVASLTAGLGNLLLYWPEAGGVFAVLFFAASFATALAFVHSYVRLRYGLAASYACQVMTNLMLLFLPRLLVPPA